MNSKAVRKGFGGAQPKMRNTKIKDSTYLGPYSNGPNCLKVGDTQKLVFSAEDDGPFYLDEVKRREMRDDEIVGEIEKNKLKSELVDELKKLNINATGTKKQLQEIATQRNIPLKKKFQKSKKVGWANRRAHYSCYGREGG